MTTEKLAQNNGSVKTKWLRPRFEIIEQVFGDDLRNNQWVMWDEENETKVPFQLRRYGAKKRAASNRPSEWGSYVTAKHRFEQDLEWAGVGFQLSNTPYTGLDLDKCRNPETGELNEAAREILRLFDTYSDISPSSKGVKLLIRGKLPEDIIPGNFWFGTQKVEIYSTLRFFTLTGLPLDGFPLEIEDRQAVLDAFLPRLTKENPNKETNEAPEPPNYEVESVETDEADIQLAEIDWADLQWGTLAERRAQYRAYLANQPGTKAGIGKARNKCFGHAITGLLEFVLSPEIVEEEMITWGEKDSNVNDCEVYYPWKPQEISAKIRSALKEIKPVSQVGERINPHLCLSLSFSDDTLAATVGELEPEPVVVETTPQDRNDSRFSYLWEGNHLLYLSDEQRSKRIGSIKNILDLVPRSGLFPAYIQHFAPTSDTPVIFHLAGCLSLVAHLLNRKVWFSHSSPRTYTNLWIGLIAESTNLRKSTAINNARDLLLEDEDYSQTIFGHNFTIEGVVSQVGRKLDDNAHVQTANDMAVLAMKTAEQYTKGVGVFHLNEIAGLLKNLAQIRTTPSGKQSPNFTIVRPTGAR